MRNVCTKVEAVRSGYFVLRFDDITPGMAWEKFLPLKEALERMRVRAVLGVVPDCRDGTLRVSSERADFFALVRQWVNFGDTVAQHGTYHVYDSRDGGMLGLQPRSEFAGLSYERQHARLAEGKRILREQGVWQPYFMAPSHSFDANTLAALRELGFLALTDGFGFHPYKKGGIVFVPQLLARPLPIPIGVQTLCVHINTMSHDEIGALLAFVSRHSTRFLDFKHVAMAAPSGMIAPTMMRIGSEWGVKVIRKFRSVVKLIPTVRRGA